MEPIVNKVTLSGIQTLDLEELAGDAKFVSFDISEHLYMGLVLKEKEFREFVRNYDWTIYRDAHVSLTCSTDAIVPTWAYMLIATALKDMAASVVYGDMDTLLYSFYRDRIDALDTEQYRDARVVIKGCSKKEVPVSAYVYLSEKLLPVVKSLMFGEPCSTVPVYKRT